MTAKLFQTTHGRAGVNEQGKKDRAYLAWFCMKQRCYYVEHKSYAAYGGRGIAVCNQWRNSFEAFLKDLGDPPPKYQLGRIDNDGHYEPFNCRWETASQQARNRRNTRYITAFGKTKPLVEWSELYGIASDTLSWRIKSGMLHEDAISKPVQFRK